MKKLLSIIIALCLSVSLIACGSGEETTSSGVENELSAAGGNPSFGTFSEQNYKNEFLGLEINFSENWVFFSREELLAANNITAETEEEQQKALNSAETVYIFYGQEINTFNTIKISAKKLSAETEIEDALLELQKATIGTLEKMSSTDIKSEMTTVKIGGSSIPASKVSSVFVGKESTRTEFLIKSGEYLITVSINAYTDTAEIVSLFSVL